MTIFKCKICGGSLNVSEGATVAECEFCGTKQTLPKISDERRINLYDRANHFRRNNEFDKAMGIYENILNEDTTDAEAYWSLVLCRYGIEYVEDPSPHNRVPTVNRAQFTSIFDDDDYKNAIKYADSLQKEIYEAEASVIDKIQKGILAITQKEEPFESAGNVNYKFFKLLQEAGYETAVVGKWHLASNPTGFNYWDILIGQGEYYDPYFIRNGERIQREGYATNITKFF